jgi:phospholipid/cholesterol/gamma-HCH transport system substrate-binding protein
MTINRSAVLQVKGLLLIATIIALVWTSIAIYQKRFTNSVMVTVVADRAGLQLSKNGDVRMRGVLIGRVASITYDDQHAVVRLALQPDEAGKVPANVQARILPTTLFGQKYVELVAPGRSSATPILAGAVIPPDRSSASIELGRALDNLGSLLTAVRPQDLSQALDSMAAGLEGRGTQLGETVVTANRFVSRLNATMPLLIKDLEMTGAVTQSYAAASPDLFRTLANVSVTSLTVTDRKAALERFTSQLTQLAIEARRFLDRNSDGLVDVTSRTAPVLRLLARYSPALPCLLRGLTIGEQRMNGTFQHDVFQLTVRLGLAYPGYTEEDRPKMGVDTGPSCAGLPDVPNALDPPEFSDGARWAPGSVLQLPPVNR